METLWIRVLFIKTTHFFITNSPLKEGFRFNFLLFELIFTRADMIHYWGSKDFNQNLILSATVTQTPRCDAVSVQGTQLSSVTADASTVDSILRICSKTLCWKSFLKSFLNNLLLIPRWNIKCFHCFEQLIELKMLSNTKKKYQTTFKQFDTCLYRVHRIFRHLCTPIFQYWVHFPLMYLTFS